MQYPSVYAWGTVARVLNRGRSTQVRIFSSSLKEGVWVSRINAKLAKALSPKFIEIVDESAGHSEHPASIARGSKETHFSIRIVSDEFDGKSLVERHRIVYDALYEELTEHVHALSLVTETPKESQGRSSKRDTLPSDVKLENQPEPPPLA